MREVEYHRWWLPASPGRKSPHLSHWAMNAEEAAALGALRPEPYTREIRIHPETEDEIRRQQVNYQAAGRDSVKPPRKE